MPFSSSRPAQAFRAAALFTVLALFPLALAADPAPAAAAAAAAPAPAVAKYPDVIATFGDQKVTKDDVFAFLVENVARQGNTAPDELLGDVVDEMLARRLVDAAAAKEGKSGEVWLQEQVGKRAKEPTDAEVSALFEQVKPQLGNQTLEQAKPQLIAYLKRQQGGQVAEQVVAELKGATPVKLFVEPARVAVSDGGRPSVGPKNAPIQIVMWSEYQCPFCSRVEPTLRQVRERYGDKVRMTFRDYPLSFHNNAQKASEAANCADEQGKFWEMHDKLFANQQALGVEDLKKYAVELKLDANKFNECLDSGRKADAVKKDLEEGSKVGVNGTPGFFINGRALSGAVPLEKFTAIIDDELRRAGITPPASAPAPAPAAGPAAKPGA